jgi:hypothetical protein
MASQQILDGNTASAAIEITGDATIFIDGVFAGAHIVLLASASEFGTYEPSDYYYDTNPRNLSIAGGGWIRVEVGNEQVDTLLNLFVNTL